MKNQSGKILIAGGCGLVGKILKSNLEKHNKTVHILSRSESADPHIHQWDPAQKIADDDIFRQRYDALINLCGAGIADQRWTSSRKKILYESRIVPTRFLWSLIKEGRLQTKKFIQISASGFYGDRPHPVNETDPPGSQDNFLVRLTKDWEEAFLEDAMDEIPQCRIRLGVVISGGGGFVHQFLTPVRFYAAPYFGDGKNYISWIHETDLAQMIHVLIEKEELDPVYNFSTPNPFTSKEFSKTLIKVFNPRAMTMAVPVWILNTAFGEMKEAIVSDLQMMPGVFQEMGYNFHAPEIEDALSLMR